MSAVLMVGLLGSPALAQPLTPQGVPAGTSPLSGARPDNRVGTGMSEPRSNHAANIDQQDASGLLAPNLRSPDLGEDAPIGAYLHAAEGALAIGRTGETQQALEMAQTRLLDRSVPLGQTDSPSTNPTVGLISQALHALAAGDRAGCMTLIQSAQESVRANRR
jgi:hypothetical protein